MKSESRLALITSLFTKMVACLKPGFLFWGELHNVEQIKQNFGYMFFLYLSSVSAAMPVRPAKLGLIKYLRI